MQILMEVWTFLKHTEKRGKYLLLLSFRSPFDSFFTLTRVFLLSGAFFAIETQNDTEYISQSILWFHPSPLLEICFIFGIANVFLYLYNGFIWQMFGANYITMSGHIKKALFRRILALPLETIEQRTQGDILSRCNQDTEMAMQMLAGPLNLPHLLIAAVNVIVSSVFLFFANPLMLALTWTFVLPHIIVNHFAVAKPMTGFQQEAQEAIASAANVMSAMIVSADDAILYDAQDLLLKEYERNSLKVRDARMKIVKRSALAGGFIPLFGLSGYMALMLAGGLQITDGSMHFYDLIAMFQLRGGILSGSLMMINCMTNLKINLAGIRRSNEMLSDSL